MKYAVKVAYTLRKLLLSALGASLLLGLLIGFLSSRDGGSFVKPFLCALIAYLILSLALIFLIASTLKKEEPLQKILAEKGYGDDYLQEFDRIYPAQTTSNKLRKADVLNTMQRYAEAEQLLATIPTVGLSDDRKMEYHNCRLDLFLGSHRIQEAMQELANCRKFMDIYANAHPERGVAYGLNAGVILAAAGDYEGSEHYIKAAEHTLEGMKEQSPVLAMIARTMQLYALGFDRQAEEQAAKTQQEIETSPILSEEWQKQHMRSLLARAAELAPQNTTKE